MSEIKACPVENHYHQHIHPETITKLCAGCPNRRTPEVDAVLEEIRKAITLIHHKDDYFGGMDILAKLAGLPVKDLSTIPTTLAGLIRARNGKK